MTRKPMTVAQAKAALARAEKAERDAAYNAKAKARGKRPVGWYWITVKDELGRTSQIPACWNGFGDKVWNAPLHDETPYQLDVPLAVGDRIPHPADAWPFSKRKAPR